MRRLGALIRCFILILVSLLFSLARFSCWAFLFPFKSLDRRNKRWILRHWAHAFAAIIRMRVETIGATPKPPFLLVANHITYFDMLVLAHETGCIFVSREDVEHWPVIGFIAKSLHILFIDRANRRDAMRVNGLIEKTLKEGDGLVIFPESRVSCGLDVEPFKSPLLQPAVTLAMPVHYASISYRTPEGSPVEGAIVGWWRPESFYAHLFRFVQYSGATATIHFGEKPLTGTDRKELAEDLHKAVQENFVPLRQLAESYDSPEFPIST
ncbi:MAG: 1-acyl-sn-glycerol-3-phosphate acyltransferase [Candidatus Hydrogenedens sp.]|nr:1-acyl-sn-glycerol-3-phosphate acyltransferase [Candidatus Hydrogenedens sp.]